MKRVFLALIFAIVGLAFEWGLPFLTALIWPTDGLQSHGEESASAELIVYFVFGGALFMLVWGWVGWSSAGQWAKAGRMILGILLGTFLIAILPRFFFPRELGWNNWRYDAAFITVWATASAALAYWLGRAPARQLSKTNQGQT